MFVPTAVRTRVVLCLLSGVSALLAPPLHRANAEANALDPRATRASCFPPGDYRVQSTVRYGVTTLAQAKVDTVVQAARRSRVGTDRRTGVAVMAKQVDGRIRALLPQMQEETEDEVQNFVLQLRRLGRWRVVTTSAAENYPILDTAYDGKRVVRSGSRQSNGERMAVYEDLDPLYYGVGPLQMIELIDTCAELTRVSRGAHVADDDGSSWTAALGSISEALYDRLRLPVLWVGIGQGTVTMHRTANALTLGVADADGSPVLHRTLLTARGRATRFLEKQWLPGYGNERPSQVLEFAVQGYEQRDADASVYPLGYWKNTRIVDTRGGRTRQVLSPSGLLPDPHFDRLWASSNRPIDESGGSQGWPLGLGVAALILILGLVGRWLSSTKGAGKA